MIWIRKLLNQKEDRVKVLNHTGKKWYITHIKIQRQLKITIHVIAYCLRKSFKKWKQTKFIKTSAFFS